MSHLKERKEKNCLNCNAEVYGKYCHICGQENLEPKETFWGLATHFVYDVMHFDGKFFSTLKYLLTKPGFLSQEYLRGRRASYLHPIRMYVFTSAIFFIIYFSFVSKPDETAKQINVTSGEVLQNELDKLKDSLYHSQDSLQKIKIGKKISEIEQATKIASDNEADSSQKKYNHSTIIGIYPDLPLTVSEYDSIQEHLPDAKQDGWFKKYIARKQIAIDSTYKGREDDFKKDLTEKFLHSIPQMMFISVPLVALVFQLVYIRRRKQFFYVNHVIFIIHVYIAIFISLLISYVFSGLFVSTGWSIFDWLKNIIMIYIFLYPVVAMRKFYGQGIIKTSIKYLIILLTCSIISALLISIFFITSLLQI